MMNFGDLAAVGQSMVVMSQDVKNSLRNIEILLAVLVLQGNGQRGDPTAMMYVQRLLQEYMEQKNAEASGSDG